MLQDVAGSLAAVVAFAAIFYAPGAVVARATNLLGYRRRSFVDRAAWAIATSFAVSPILGYAIGRLGGLPVLAAVFFLFAAGAVFLRGKDTRPSARELRLLALIACGWVVFVLLMSVDFQHGHQLWFSVPMADQSYRIAFTDAVARSGVPPADPLYFPGAAAPMSYYYFWYVLCAAVMKLGGVSAAQAYFASCVWSGFGLLAVTRLFTQHFFQWQSKQRWTAIFLLAVTGADLLPAAGQWFQPALNGDVEWWSVDPIDAWPDSLLWVPHHVASVLACMFAFLLLWNLKRDSTPRQRMVAVALGGAACASAFGMSVYVALGFAVMMAAWLVWLFVRSQPNREIYSLNLVLIAVSAGVIGGPFLHELLTNIARSSSPGAGHAHMFLFSVRRMIDSGLLTGMPALAAINAAHPQLLDQSIRLLLLLPGLAMELGLFGAVFVYLLRSRRRGELATLPARDTAIFLTIAGLVLTMFVSSSVISNNDFGYRAVMLPQLFLWLLTAEVVASWRFPTLPRVIPATKSRRIVVTVLFVLGVAGSLYGAVLMRAWLPGEAHAHTRWAQLPAEEYQARELFTQLDHVAAKDAVVVWRPLDILPNPDMEVMRPDQYYQRLLVMDTGRQMLNTERPCSSQFGGDPSACGAIMEATDGLFAMPAPSAAAAREYCRRFRTQYLLLTHRNAAWSATSGWPVELPVVVAQPLFRVYACGS